MRDKSKKGRSNSPKGEDNKKSKVNASQVIEIRSSKKSLGQLAKEYGLSRSAVFSIKKLKTWRHITWHKTQ
jgi:hypothetical protein